MNHSGQGSSDSAVDSLSDVFYELADNLCQRYSALTPFIVRREKFGEVIRLVIWINSKNLRKQGVSSANKAWKDKNGNIHIRRQATNDNWY